MPNSTRMLLQHRSSLDIGSSDCSGLTACSILFNGYALLNLHMHRLSVLHGYQNFSVVCLPHQANHFQILFRGHQSFLFIRHNTLSFPFRAFLLGAGCLSDRHPVYHAAAKGNLPQLLLMYRVARGYHPIHCFYFVSAFPVLLHTAFAARPAFAFAADASVSYPLSSGGTKPVGVRIHPIQVET